MNFEDVLVGGLSLLLGAVTLLAVATGRDWLYEMRVPRFLKRRYGHGAARVFYVVLGVVLIGLGITVMQGFRLVR